MQKIYSTGKDERNDFYELMAATQAAEKHGAEWGLMRDIFDEGYIHQFQPGPTHKIQ